MYFRLKRHEIKNTAKRNMSSSGCKSSVVEFLAAMSSSRSDVVTQFQVCFKKFQKCFNIDFKGVSRMFQRSCKKVLRGFNRVFRKLQGSSRVFHLSFKGFSRVFQRSFNGLSAKFQGHFKRVFKVISWKIKCCFLSVSRNVF